MYNYDNRGNRSQLTGVTPSSPDATYGYDKRDRLSSVTIGSNAVTYKYNGDGLLLVLDNLETVDFLKMIQGKIDDITKEYENPMNAGASDEELMAIHQKAEDIRNSSGFVTGQNGGGEDITTIIAPEAPMRHGPEPLSTGE